MQRGARRGPRRPPRRRRLRLHLRRQALGQRQLLAELGAARGFGVTVVPPVTVDGIVCSSTKVREFVLEGRVDGAALAARPRARGRGRGRARRRARAHHRRADGEPAPRRPSCAQDRRLRRLGRAASPTASAGRRAINVGTNPTFVAGQSVRVEAHLLDCDEDLYGERLRVGFSGAAARRGALPVEGCAGGADHDTTRRTRRLDGDARGLRPMDRERARQAEAGGAAPAGGRARHRGRAQRSARRS